MRCILLTSSQLEYHRWGTLVVLVCYMCTLEPPQHAHPQTKFCWCGQHMDQYFWLRSWCKTCYTMPFLWDTRLCWSSVMWHQVLVQSGERSYSLCTNLLLTLKSVHSGTPILYKPPYTDFHENLTNNLVADTRIWTDGWMWSPHWVFLLTSRTIPEKQSAHVY